MDRPLQEVLWLNCPAKRCCYTRTVLPTGADIWRIATALDAAPESFLRMLPVDSAMGEGFVLDHQRQSFQAALARRAHSGRTAACVFLVVLNERAARCGLDALRPIPCQVFPAVGTPDMIRVEGDTGCTCRTWGLAELDRANLSGRLRRQQAEQQQYLEVIRAWNAHVARQAVPQFTFGDFCRYVLHAYAAPGQGAAA